MRCGCNGEMIRLHLNEIMHCPSSRIHFGRVCNLWNARIKFAILGVHLDSHFLYMKGIQSSLMLFNSLFLVCRFFFTTKWRRQVNMVRKLFCLLLSYLNYVVFLSRDFISSFICPGIFDVLTTVSEFRKETIA